MVSIQYISKVYGSGDTAFTALEDVNFEVQTGDTLAIIGKSGSGKSTLMHIMSGLDHPTSGQIEVDGQNIFKLNPAQMDRFRARSMSFIFQAFFVEPGATCLQNVMLPLEIAEVPARERRERVLEALAAVDLADKAEVMAVNLSGGQKQRLAIARAIVGRPGILFADEPTGNLDSATGDKIMDLLFQLNRELNCTLVLVTHDHELAARCDRQIVMRDGRVQSDSGAAGRGAGDHPRAVGTVGHETTGPSVSSADQPGGRTQLGPRASRKRTEIAS